MTQNLKPWPGTDKLLKLNWASSSSRGSREEFSIYVGDLSPEVRFSLKYLSPEVRFSLVS